MSGERLAMMAAILGGLVYARDPNIYRNGVTRTSHPWDDIQLSKAERRGKTPEEIQALRKAKWEAEHGK